MKKTAIIVAGGSGQRMGSDLPKQFLMIHGKPIFLYSIESFLAAIDDIEILLVLPVDYHDFARKMMDDAKFDVNLIKIISGGSTRFHSVQNGLNTLSDDGIVFIHDAVRCMVSIDLIQRCLAGCIEKGSAIPVLEVRDSMRRLNRNGNSEIVSRENLRIVQTPQTFYAKQIKDAFNVAYLPTFTDEASVLESSGFQVNLVNGEESNIKLTFPDDLIFAEWKIGLRGVQNTL
jgi:2-C-methyl-D-erythritol 4-phosphate cytidylyltransferase